MAILAHFKVESMQLATHCVPANGNPRWARFATTYVFKGEDAIFCTMVNAYGMINPTSLRVLNRLAIPTKFKQQKHQLIRSETKLKNILVRRLSTIKSNMQPGTPHLRPQNKHSPCEVAGPEMLEGEGNENRLLSLLGRRGTPVHYFDPPRRFRCRGSLALS